MRGPGAHGLPGATPEGHKIMIHHEDVNLDGEMDAVFHCRTQETGLLPGAEEFFGSLLALVLTRAVRSVRVRQ